MSITLTAIPGAPAFQLDATAAASLGRAIAAGCPVNITNAYRSPEWQQQLYDGWLRRLPGYNFALPPSQSNHCKGIAIDTAGSMLTWLRTRGEQYGWTPDANEAWHFNYDAARDVMAVSNNTTTTTTAGALPADLTATLPDALEALMAGPFRFSVDGDPAVWFADLSTGVFYQIPDVESLGVIDQYAKPTQVSANARQRDLIRALCRSASASVTDPTALAAAISSALPTGSTLSSADVETAVRNVLHGA